LDHLAVIDDPRERWRVAYPLPEVLLPVVCGTIADCDDCEGIAEWGEAHLAFLRRFLPTITAFTAASSNEPSPSPTRLVGSMAAAASPARSACPMSRQLSGSPHRPN
jgi:DDE_Tnp_1-associated